MHVNYAAKGICAVKIEFDLEDQKVKNVVFSGGCDGNHKGLSRLLEGMPAEDVIKKFKGLTCGGKTSSCPDQLAVALEAQMKK